MATAEKTILTRIINKNASLTDWMSSTLPLKKGEIALAYIETKQTATDDNGNITVQYVPTYLMKVGDGTHTFKDLNWLAAPASDVYDWAKKAALDANDLPAEWKRDVDQAVADVNTHKTSKLDKATYDAFISADGDFGKLKAAVDDFFADTANADEVVNRLVEIQEILETTQDAQGLIQRVADLEEWYESHHSALEKVTEQKIQNWDTAFTNTHVHSNQTLLDSIVAENVHTHTNKDELDKIQANDVAKWNAIESNIAGSYVKYNDNTVEYIFDCGGPTERITS